MQQIRTVITTATQIILRDGKELLQYQIRQQEQHSKEKWTYLRTIFLSSNL